MNSRDKGKRGELELAHKLQAYGYDTRRGQQFSGANGDADVVGLPHIHIECKRYANLFGKMYEFLAQAKRDAKNGALPCVFYRADRQDWFVTMTLDDWLALYRRGEEWQRMELRRRCEE